MSNPRADHETSSTAVDSDNASPSASGYSSCDESENERYSSANSFLDSASACGSTRSRTEFFDSFRSLSFGDDLRSLSGRDLVGVDSFRSSNASVDGRLEILQDDAAGEFEDRLFRGRLDSLPRIQTRPSARGRSGRSLPIPRGGDVVESQENCSEADCCFRDASSARLPRRDSVIENGGDEDGDLFTQEDDEGDDDAKCNCPEVSSIGHSSLSRGSRRSGDGVPSTYLGPFDTETIANANGEDLRLNGSSVFSAAAKKLKALGSNGSLNSLVAKNDGTSDLKDEISAAELGYMSSSFQQNAGIHKIEVVGATQRKGDVSFGERLIGVKEHGIYKLRVQSGNNQWEIERRYHDFFLLYCQLKVLYADHGIPLPPPWSKVPHESRKIFGNASPAVIRERSVLIQDCLQSILSMRTPFGIPNSLIWFLSPSNAFCDSTFSVELLPEPFRTFKNDALWDSPTLSESLSHMVELKSRKSMRELLDEQGYTCAGCHRYLNSKMSPIEGLIQMLGWGRFQLCEFTGQLFCSSCHVNDTAVLPARVLHHWDFTLYSISKSSKMYLESVYSQPILCISAVNPFLFLKVSSLIDVIDLRKKIGSLLPYIRCPFIRSIEMYFGSRKYLLEASDFFALRDLVDLSKGPFAELPTLLETLLCKIHKHIMQQCPVCYELGLPCAAQNACRIPSSLIFPLQEGGIRCSSCCLIYHEACFGYVALCPCGKATSVSQRVGLLGLQDPGEEIELDGVVDSPTRESYGQSSGYISELLSKARPDFQWKPRNSRLVVTMNSLLDAFS